MFPPGNASPATAIREHLRLRAAPYAGLVGPLLVPSARWNDFLDAHTAAGSPSVAVALVGSSELPVELPPDVDVVGFEVPVRNLPLPEVDPAQRLACEIAADPDCAKLLAGVADRRREGYDVIGKFRTGGTTAEAFPPAETVAEVILLATAAAVPLKFTAGLHSAVRHTDPVTRFEQQGFLNLMAATLLARQGADATTVTDVLNQQDEVQLCAQAFSWSAAEVDLIRAGFVSFGCCGVEDPVRELTRLRLLGEEDR
jgi:hypothetical protein